MTKYLSAIAMAAIGMPAAAADLDRLYGGVGGGIYQLEIGDFDDVAPTLKLLAGYKVNEFVGIEVSYTELYESSELIGNIRKDVDGSVWGLSTRLSYPMRNRFIPFVRLGYSSVDIGAIETEGGVATRVGNRDNAFTWSIGSAYRMTDRFTVSGELARTRIDDGDLDFLTVKLNYEFGYRKRRAFR